MLEWHGRGNEMVKYQAGAIRLVSFSRQVRPRAFWSFLYSSKDTSLWSIAAYLSTYLGFICATAEPSTPHRSSARAPGE